MLFSKFGLDFSTAITLFLQQSVREQRIPFEIRIDVPNKETKEAFDELTEMKTNKDKYKRYDSFAEVLQELNDTENSSD